MEFKQPAFVERIISKVGGDKKAFGDIIEDEVASKTIGKQRARRPGFDEDIILELKAMRRSFRKRIKRLRRKLNRVSKYEHPNITTQIDHMRSVLAMHPEKLIKLIKVTALLRNLRQKPEFLTGAVKLHVIHRKYGRKPVENAKKHIQGKRKK